MQNDVIVELTDVDVVYDIDDGDSKTALQGIHLAIHQGEFVAIVGHNGSGKSTLSKLLNGLLVPTAGTVLVAGMDTRDTRYLHDIHGVVGMVFQDPETQMVSMTVEDDVAFGLENYSVSPGEMKSRVESALRLVGMAQHRRRAPHQLSGGQKQRVAIAAVMAMQPRCIVFDEATSMLDAEGREAVMMGIRKLHADGVAVVLVTHHMEEAVQAQRIVVMQEGRVACDAAPRDVFLDADLLRTWSIEPPIALDVAMALRSLGWDLAGQPLVATELAVSLETTRCGTDRPEGLPHSEPHEISPLQSTTSSSEPLIRIRDLTHAYMRRTPMEHQSLHGISVDIWPGEFVAVVGQTGSGKSTFMQHLNGLLRPQTGSVIVDGINIGDKGADIRALRSRVGLAFQNPEDQLFEALIGDDVAYGPFQYGMPMLEVRERVRFALEAVGLSYEWRDRPVHGLSGGERRKVALAGVLAMGPRILVLDEPTSGLDPQSRRELASNLRRLGQGAELTVIWVTHQLEEAARYATRVLVMADGLIVADTTPSDLFSKEDLLPKFHLRLPEAPKLAADLRGCGFPVQGYPLTRGGVVVAIDSELRRGKED